VHISAFIKLRRTQIDPTKNGTKKNNPKFYQALSGFYLKIGQILGTNTIF
jgi:hypothetical protein